MSSTPFSVQNYYTVYRYVDVIDLNTIIDLYAYFSGAGHENLNRTRFQTRLREQSDEKAVKLHVICHKGNLLCKSE
jgi:hypothetical protein